MGKLTEDEIRHIIKRASVFQKFEQQSPHKLDHFTNENYETLFEIADNLQVERKYIQEAITEHFGIEIDDPISVDTGSQSEVEIKASANGFVDGGTLNEIKAQLEYHFNTVGNVTRRKNKLFWNAQPAGISKFFEITSSPQLEVENSAGRVKLRLTQNLRTYNKLFAPITGAIFGAFMLFAAVILGVADNDAVAPMLVFSGLLFTASFFFSRFIKRKKIKRKKRLKELMEVLQQTIERKFKTGAIKEDKKVRISIPNLEEIDEDITVTSSTKVNT